ncbi:uncharacterized protein N7458_004896 [Penicillium daleae]|uniref:Uncharacterized protein n=1 Tax=Penicillium daleae TaxID=63821 RepID=A0AAD6G4A1_9EURO|nr:uncharacterized protein N7458_004896 [Penicillium daleae]KAJ5453940.1 hypothetical protein N7458_004896 [Penicillium daleae]
MPSTTLLKAAGYGSFLVAIKHAVSFELLENNSSDCISFRNYQTLRIHTARLVGTKEVIIAWSSSAWYLRRGIRTSGLLTAMAGILQAYATLH